VTHSFPLLLDFVFCFQHQCTFLVCRSRLSPDRNHHRTSTAPSSVPNTQDEFDYESYDPIQIDATSRASNGHTARNGHPPVTVEHRSGSNANGSMSPRLALRNHSTSASHPALQAHKSSAVFHVDGYAGGQIHGVSNQAMNGANGLNGVHANMNGGTNGGNFNQFHRSFSGIQDSEAEIESIQPEVNFQYDLIILFSIIL
jgi:hypothetical protein